jgi:hypothetical protein
MNSAYYPAFGFGAQGDSRRWFAQMRQRLRRSKKIFGRLHFWHCVKTTWFSHT